MIRDTPIAIGVLTSGGDAQGMNAALRAVVRAALSNGAAIYAIYEGYQGLVDGGDRIRPLGWDDVGGIMYRGGTVIGTARSAAFRTREGRLRAAQHLIERGIDRLVVIGGDGSLTGADTFRREWPGLVAELVATGTVGSDAPARFPHLGVVGLVGSIDNDFCGTDMTIGADSALWRITEAIDALSSTAASHQRTFVVEVMGRHCGYLALMGAVAGGADWVLIPESPPEDGWEERMCALLQAGRAAGRRDSIVIVAEGAIDRRGQPISCAYVQKVLSERLGEDTRVTILGHVQRGGAPSAFDRWMSTLLGYAAVGELLATNPASEPQLIGIRDNRITHAPLMRCVEDTRAVAGAIAAGDYDRALALRGRSFTEMFRTFHTLAQALPSVSHPERRGRIAVLNAGGPAPGMNTAVRAAVRLALDRGHTVLAVRNSLDGLVAGTLEPFQWGSVDGWGALGGVELGTSRREFSPADIAAIATVMESQQIEGLLICGGWAGYQAALALAAAREQHPALRIPIVCMPVSIDNNLPGTEISIGADTAINNIVEAVDKIKQSAVAISRAFVVEVMGRDCGYLALMSGLATGAEQVYLPETGITLSGLQHDIAAMVSAFSQGKRLSLMIRSEHANRLYTTEFLRALFEQEGHGLFDVRQAILGHIQQGGTPSPFDRIQATRLAARCIQFLDQQIASHSAESVAIGIRTGRVEAVPLAQLPALIDMGHQRPRDQWWLTLRPIAASLAQSGPPDSHSA